MVKTSWRHADGRPEYAFTCGTCKRHGRGACTPHTISARALTQVILSDLSRILSHCENLPGLARQQAERFLARWSGSAAHGAVPESSRAGGDARQLEREEFHLQSLLRSSYEDYKAGLLSRQEFLSCQKDFRRRKKLCADRLRVLREQNEVLAARIGRSPFLREAAGAAQGADLAAECADSATPGADLAAECADSAAPGAGPAADCTDAFSSGAAQAIFPDRGLLRQLISRIVVHENRKIQIIYLFPPDDTFSLPGQYSIKN